MTTIYTLTRCLSGDCELIHLSTDRKHLADLMRKDIDKWTVPVTYTIEITFAFDNLFREGRVSAFRATIKELKKVFVQFYVGTNDGICFRQAYYVVEDLFEEETRK